MELKLRDNREVKGDLLASRMECAAFDLARRPEVCDDDRSEKCEASYKD